MTQVVRTVPLGGLENMATMKASATGITAASKRPAPHRRVRDPGESVGHLPRYYAAASLSGIAVTT